MPSYAQGHTVPVSYSVESRGGDTGPSTSNWVLAVEPGQWPIELPKREEICRANEGLLCAHGRDTSHWRNAADVIMQSPKFKDIE